MRFVKPFLAALVLSVLCLVATPARAAADVNDFTINNFRAEETLTNTDKQGQLHIVEYIDLTFRDFNHGILRAIPARYKGHSLQLHINKITSSSGAPTMYTTSWENGNTVVKIGDPNRTITGSQQYTIDYTLRNVISFYGDHDELYWDINGDQWQQSFDHISVRINLPKGLEQLRQPLCYAGSYGGKSQNCTATSGPQQIISETTTPLQLNQTLTVVAAFKPGYFHMSSLPETILEYSKQLIGIFGPILLIGGAGFIYWFRVGRDPRSHGTIVPQYDPPKNLNVLESACIYDFKISSKDITATIVNLAVRKYIRIIESSKGGGKHEYSLELLSSDYSGLDANEQQLMRAIFSVPSVGEKVGIKSSNQGLHNTLTELDANVKKELKSAGYFRSTTKLSFGRALHLVWSVPTVLGGIIAVIIIAASWAAAGVVIGLIILTFFLIYSSARTSLGVDAKNHLSGLKLYLNVAEKTRIEKLQAPNAAYAAPSAEPEKTVDLFERLLPYAIVLGVERQWAEQFKDLYNSPPDWYQGNWNTFSAAYLASSLSDGVSKAVGSAFSSPSSSSSSGFGGGGFSGGGGGGGGGGGW